MNDPTPPKSDDLRSTESQKKPKQIRRKKRQPYEEITLRIDDTPENVAKAMFKLNPAKPGFEWDYMKERRQD